MLTRICLVVDRVSGSRDGIGHSLILVHCHCVIDSQHVFPFPVDIGDSKRGILEEFPFYTYSELVHGGVFDIGGESDRLVNVSPVFIPYSAPLRITDIVTPGIGSIQAVKDSCEHGFCIPSVVGFENRLVISEDIPGKASSGGESVCLIYGS